MIFVEDAASAVTPLDAEMIQISNAGGQRAERRGLVQRAVRPVRVIEVLVLAQHDHQVAMVPDQVRSSSSRRQLPIHRSMIEFILGACTAEGMTLIPADWKTGSNGALKLASQHAARAWPGCRRHRNP
jgi:hypothetical protein